MCKLLLRVSLKVSMLGVLFWPVVNLLVTGGNYAWAGMGMLAFGVLAAVLGIVVERKGNNI
ncbi:MAG TPA: hypothetical protein VHW66_02700 [Stellaceae bacterium]|jgi:hypothetical protein|nr:hypothetical protein [Stellaceae bacterium]